MINLIIAVILFLVSVFFATISDSLRNFLRSRLASVCRVRGKEDRFGLILRDDEVALRACEFVQVTTFVLAVILFTLHRYWHLPEIKIWRLWGDLLLVTLGCWLTVWVFPWSISRVAAEPILYFCWPLIQLMILMTRPALVLVRQIDTLMHRVAGRSDPSPENLETFAEEIQSVVDEGEREGILESHSGRMIQRVMELREEDVRAVMTPRTEIVSIQASCNLATAREELLAAGHSRIPVVDGSMDEIIGVLYARDLLESFINGHEQRSLTELVRPPFYVPETTTINTLLDRMKQERLHLAIVLDEYGGVTGLVTLEDILEEIVGDIADEFDDRPEELFRFLDAYTLRVDARMHLDELNALFDLNLPDDKDFDTIGGFVFSELGRVPKQGEQLQWEQLRITVVAVTERKLEELDLFSPIPWPQDEMPQANSTSSDSR